MLSLDFTLLLDSKAVEVSTPISIQKRARLNFLRPRQKVKYDEAQIALVEMKPATFSNSVDLDTLRKNVGREGYQLRVERSRTIRSRDRDILITNRVYASSSGPIPLFYGCTLPAEAINVALHIPTEINAYFEYDEAGKVIYSNCNTYIVNDSYLPARVSYQVDSESFNHIIDLNVLFREIDYSDYDMDTFEILPNRTVYSLSRNMRGEYVFDLNCNGPFYIKEREELPIEVRRYLKEDPELPWYLEITKGIERAGAFEYKILEYDAQTFFPYFPFQLEIVEASVFSKNTLRLRGRKFGINPAKNLHYYVEHRNSIGKLIGLYTSDSTRVGKPLNQWTSEDTDVLWESKEVNVDNLSGVLTFNESLFSEKDMLILKAPIRQENLVYREVNLNPRFNERVDKGIYLFYVKPVSLIKNNKSVYYVYAKGFNNDIYIEDTNDDALKRYIGTHTLAQITDLYFASSILTGESVENDTQYLPICVASKNRFYQNSISVTDLRLEDQMKETEDVIRKHPLLYHTNAFKAGYIDIPNRNTVLIEIDSNWSNSTDYREAIDAHISAATLYTYKAQDRSPNILSVHSNAEDTLTFTLIGDPFCEDYNVYITDSSHPDLVNDVSDYSFTCNYDGISTVDVTLSGYSSEIINVYVRSILPGRLSSPSAVYKLRIS